MSLFFKSLHICRDRADLRALFFSARLWVFSAEDQYLFRFQPNLISKENEAIILPYAYINEDLSIFHLDTHAFCSVKELCNYSS